MPPGRWSNRCRQAVSERVREKKRGQIYTFDIRSWRFGSGQGVTVSNNESPAEDRAVDLLFGLSFRHRT